jgi:ubiquinone/menaquinone biosynthesis C-methylase UbiE
VDESGLKRAQEDDHGADLVLMSAEHLAFKDDLFDIVLLIEVLEHVKDDRKALEEIHRVLKPGGLAILTAPNKLFPFETHGISIGPRIIGTRGLGFPLLPYLPTPLRNGSQMRGFIQLET